MAATVQRLKSPKDWKERQLGNLKAVGQRNYDKGIAAPKKDPIKAGIDAQDRYEEQMRRDEVLARRKEGLQATGLDEWFSYASEIGAGRLVDGVTKREAEVSKFVEGWQPVLKSHVEKIDAMPAVTDSDMENRMLENLRGLKANKGAWR